MLDTEEIFLIGYVILVIIMLLLFVVISFYIFQKRKNKLLSDRFSAERRFEEELVQTRLEIQEQTLRNVGWELHDNIGQLLSVAKMQLNMLSRTKSDIRELDEINEVIADSLQEVRALSQSLNREVVEFVGLQASIENALARFERLKVLDTKFRIEGVIPWIPKEDTIILFRICQEFLSNALKHAQATKVEVEIIAEPEVVTINCSDDGTGFDPADITKSSGLLNMESRANLLEADFKLLSSPGRGTHIILRYPILKEEL